MEVLDYLKKIESAGFSCYIVGGYVRDKLLGIDSVDVDITTSARPNDLAKIFPSSNNSNFGCTNIRAGKLNIDITTYRKEGDYENRSPKKVIYIDDVWEDLQRRDFTMNAILMDSKGKIYDPLHGKRDLDAKILKVVGDIPTKFEEDPLRMLRALRFSIIYDFELERDALEFIKNNMQLFERISMYRRKEELSKILISKNAQKGLLFLKDLGLLDIYKIEMNEKYNIPKDLIGAWATLSLGDAYPFTKNEQDRLKNIRSILNSKKINSETLLEYGLYDTCVAGEIIGTSKIDIDSMWKSMPIHHESELAISGDTIKSILEIDSGPIIKNIKKYLIKEVLSGNLSNNEEELSQRTMKIWK